MNYHQIIPPPKLTNIFLRWTSYVTIKIGNQQVPFWNYGQEELYINSNPVERAIYEMQKLSELTENYKKQKLEGNDVKVLTIPFEPFVLDPWPYLEKIE